LNNRFFHVAYTDIFYPNYNTMTSYRVGFKPTGPIALQLGPALNGPRAGVIYSRLFKYTDQHTACFSENCIGPRIS